MKKRTTWQGGLPAMSILLIASVTLSGCSYLQARYNDAKDIADVGITVSKKPGIAAYASGPFAQVAAIGLGYVDGRFLGMGEGRLSFFGPHYEKSIGVGVWGMEWISYYHNEAEIDAMPPKEAAKASNHMQVGVLGMLAGLAGDGPPAPSRQKYAISCPHYLHVGWIGVVAGPRYLQMLDFVLGWTTLDICSDDKPRVAKSAPPPVTEEEVPADEPSAPVEVSEPDSSETPPASKTNDDLAPAQ
ncbi:hypothetical protein JW916_01775 [Candidatus Sumerlaeota bacterium]|nr:hypothetical protein [Candidatus Sumerlaeota bacterium]